MRIDRSVIGRGRTLAYSFQAVGIEAPRDASDVGRYLQLLPLTESGDKDYLSRRAVTVAVKSVTGPLHYGMNCGAEDKDLPRYGFGLGHSQLSSILAKGV